MLDGATLAHGLSDSPAGLLAWLLERWNAWSDNGGDVESVFTKDDLLTHATIYWVNNSIATSMRYYANANRYPWAPAHDRTPVVQAPVGLTFVAYENPPGIHTANERVRAFKTGPQADWFNHVNVNAHDHGGHFIPWENPERLGQRPAAHLPRTRLNRRRSGPAVTGPDPRAWRAAEQAAAGAYCPWPSGRGAWSRQASTRPSA